MRLRRPPPKRDIPGVDTLTERAERLTSELTALVDDSAELTRALRRLAASLEQIEGNPHDRTD